MLTIMDIVEAVLDFRVPPHPNSSRLVRTRVSEFALEHRISEDDLSHFLIAVGEALANALEHARAKAPIDVEVRIGGDRIVATVQDNGVGFASPVISEAHFPASDTERGRGLPIMRRCCDIFALKSEPGKGTAVVLGRYIRRRREPVAGAA